jgi:hypothetical protein
LDLTALNMTTLRQIIPYGSEVDISEHYGKDYCEMIAELEKSCDGHLLETFPAEIHNPYPIGVTLNSFYIMKRVMGALHRGLQSVVEAYFDDPRLHSSLLCLPDNIVKVLETVKHRPYKIGSWRPDILFPDKSTDVFLVCEINARFPFNGYYVSHAKNVALSKMSYLQNIPIMPIHELEGVPGAFSGVYDRHKPVGILKPSGHAGWDVNLFHFDYSSTTSSQNKRRRTEATNSMHTDSRTMPESRGSRKQPPNGIGAGLCGGGVKEVGAPVSDEDAPEAAPPSLQRHFSNTFQIEHSGTRFIDPSCLHIGEDGNIYDKSDSAVPPSPLHQFALEMSQAELFAMPSDVLHAIATSCTYMNDLRTILLAHDKRMLAILTTPEIMSDYLSPEDVTILQRYVTTTFICGARDRESDPLHRKHAQAVEDARANRHEWMIKPNGGGKGIGIVFGRDCADAEEWEGILDDPSRSTHVLQRVVPQHTFTLFKESKKRSCSDTPSDRRCGGKSESGFQDMLMVGVLHCFNEHFLGPGIFRASSMTNPIVNVSGGNGIILSPVILSCKWPLSRCTLVQHGDQDKKDPRTDTHTPLMFNMPPHCVFTLTDGASVFCDIQRCVLSEGIALVHTNWQGGIIGTIDSHNRDADAKLNDMIVEFVERLGGVVNLHSGDASTAVWDVRPICAVGNDCSDHGEVDRPARSLTAEAFEMHTVSISCINSCLNVC